MLLTWLLSAGIVVVLLMTPTYLQKVYGISPADALTANSQAIVALTLGCIVYGRLIDLLGSGITFMFGSLLLAGSSYAPSITVWRPVRASWCRSTCWRALRSGLSALCPT